MHPPIDPEALAFRVLRKRLTHRRLAQLDFRLRLELAGLALLLVGFLFWQIRVPLDGLRRHAGPLAVMGVMTAAWSALALLAGMLVALRHARRLREADAGPAWLALPVTPARLAAHLAWESRLHALWVLIPGIGVLTAAVGLVPLWWLPLLGALFAWALLEAGRAGAALGEWLARPRSGPLPGLPGVIGALGAAAVDVRRPRVPPARWRRLPPALALWHKDLALTGRVPVIGRSALVALALWILSVLAWRLPGDPGLRHFTAFVLAMLGAAAVAEWLVTISGSDPFATLRVLPAGVGAVWGARFAWALLGAAGLAIAHGLAANDLSPHALRVFLVWVSAATLGIGALGINYGVTLFPRADIAQRLLGLSLALAVAASVMIPLAGWVVLLSAIVHSARRLPQWSRLEEA